MTPFTADKMFLHADRIAARQRGELPPPVTVELDVTNVCNHDCPECTFSHLVNVGKEVMPLELAGNVVDQLGRFGVRAVTFSGGGEPLLYGESRIIWLMAQVREHGMDAALITNGSKLYSERFLDLCTWVRVSLDAYDAATFARFHGRNEAEFHRVCERVRGFAATAAAKKAAGARCATVGVGFLTDKESVKRGDFDRMAEFCAGIDGLDYVQFRPMVPSMISDKTLAAGLMTQEEAAAIHQAWQAAQRFARPGYRVLYSSGKYAALAEPNGGRTYASCTAHFLQATISADCKVYVCCHTQGQAGFCLGDLRADSFETIWNSQRAKDVIATIDPRHECPPACRLHMQNQALDRLQESDHANFI